MKKVLMLFFFCLLFSVSVQAKTTLPTDKTTAGAGCTLVGVEGSYVTQAKEALKRINEIRYEACKEGIQKMDEYGDPTTEKLTIKDYKPIKWSLELEYIARIRAAEASVVNSHDRPNGEDCFDLKDPMGHESWGEVLAWNCDNTMLEGIEQWYSEKEDWVNQTEAVTGHYTQMINPNNTYVALATFLNPNVAFFNTTAGEFSSEDNLSEKFNTISGECTQIIEVENSLLSQNLLLEQNNIKAEKQTKAYVKANGCKVFLLGNVVWSSSNKKVASVDQNGKISGVDIGSATITATDGNTIRKVTVNVTTHAWDKGTVRKKPTFKKTGIAIYTCKVCGKKKTETIKKLSKPKVGSVYNISGNKYKITKTGATLVKTNSTAQKINIPSIIKVNGLTYKVTAIASKAFKQNKKLKSVTVGSNIKSISNNAFFKCVSLKKVNLKTILLTNKTVGKKVFKGSNKRLKIKVPKKVKKSYKKIFKGLKVE